MKLVHGLHQESPRVVELEVGFHHGCLGGDHRCLRVVKLVMGLHSGSPKLVKLEIGLHHGCPDSDYRSPGVVKLVMGLHHGSPKVMKLVMGLHHGSPRVVKLEVGLHQGCYIKEHEVSRGGEASDGASPSKVQKDKVHDGTSPWEFQGA